MFRVAPSNFRQEIRAAEGFRDRYQSNVGPMRDGYTGPYWSEQYGKGMSGRTDPENHAFEWVSRMVPSMAMGRARARVKTSRQSESHKQVAEALQSGLNRWSAQSNLIDLQQMLAVDWGFTYAVARVSREWKPRQDDWDDLVGWPTANRVSQGEFVIDPLAFDRSKIRFCGHKVIEDLQDLVDHAEDNPDEGWIMDALDALVADATKRDEENASRSGDPSAYIDVVPRGEVQYYEVYVPDWDPDRETLDENGEVVEIPHAEAPDPDDEDYHYYNGWIFYVATDAAVENNADSFFIREAQPFFGPLGGPYVMDGAYYVPDAIIPLGPITANEPQARFLNDHTRSAGKSMDAYKKIIVVNSTEVKVKEAITVGEHLHVLPIPGFDQSQVIEVELGGITQQHLAIMEWARASLDRNSGMTEAQRGNMTGATATESDIAATAANARQSYVVDRFRRFVEKILYKVGWYLYYDDTIEFPLSSGEGGEGFKDESGAPMAEPWFRGGDPDPESGATYDDLSLTIESYSMSRTSEGMQQLRFQQLMGFVAQVAPIIPQTPWVRWERVMELAGEMMNAPEISSLIDVDMAMKVAGVQIQQSVNQGQPLLGRDAGQAGKGQPAASGASPGATNGSALGGALGAPLGGMLSGAQTTGGTAA